MERLSRYLRDTVAEMKHVKWPTTSQAATYTVLVVVISAVVALTLSGFDYLFTNLLEVAI
ncbi:preprotein translocase subunit SecE [Candidatus Kaiserbacteria bacterium RIFCSPHIGHO2_01_FULL_46_22]|uniref:Protein translocase subunit SecE n=1 Tax=Candidatus Kaiserbacteria bacterium RIFCSPHIGHO2_01_FULL_46_22 TaxID=1798475 RepID=A0A1F6BX77_9BACT|nr:MAG: preprotein translocase subunit SecE [Candidatus Kaiserbacteria bacterium RIFCSPHIGHO2_01_FULL_46_22]